MKTLWKEPLLHFLLIGIVLFAVYDFRREDSGETPGRILVTAGQVDQFTARFQRTWLRPPTDAELAGLIEGHVRDEVYYRQARDMGLDQDDAMVRQRMRLKLEFLLEDLTSQLPPTDEQLLQFMQAHPDKYQQDRSFHSHRFISTLTYTRTWKQMRQNYSPFWKTALSPNLQVTGHLWSRSTR
jgi:hypothetical protein